MIRGLDVFKKHFAQFADRYVVIGGVAASLTAAQGRMIACQANNTSQSSHVQYSVLTNVPKLPKH